MRPPTFHRVARRFCSPDAFFGGWTLPYRQIPWALPFKIQREAAVNAFGEFSKSKGEDTPRINVKTVRPVLVPFYVFEGSLDVSFTGIVGYDENDEYAHENIHCPPVQLGANTGAVSAVYAGFSYRRLFLRQALAGGLTEEILQTAVASTRLPPDGLPAGAVLDEFEMKPSFAFNERLMERLPEVAHHEAESLMRTEEVRELTFSRPSPDGVAAVSEVSIQPSDCSRPPDYDRVEEVSFELKEQRLHDKGVVLLPVWAIEYTCLGQRYRGFVSGLPPRPGGGLDDKPIVAGMSHINPWSPSGGRTADAARMWSTIGAMRFEEKETNVDWRVQRYWLDEVARVMPDEQKPKGKQNTGARSRAFKSFLPGGGKVDEEDYEVMGLVSSPPPTSSAIKTAFRRQCLKWHPDKQQDKSEEERAQCQERFQRICLAHERLRARHPEYLDGRA